ncbi:MAG: alpha/beta fold hydrolase, partial [Haloarculaceae archaeon]
MNHEEWTAQQTSATLPVDGHDLEVAYYEAGSEHGGPPVLFLHGIPTWSYLWRDVAPALAADRHVVVPDLLGYGNSAKHDGFDRSIRAQAVMVGALLDHLGADTAALVAHDIGGGTALRLAARGNRVQRLVLSNAACYDSWPVEFVHGLGLPGMTEELADDAALEERLAFVFDSGLYGDPGDHAAFCEGMRAPWQSDGAHVSLVRAAIATNTNHTAELDYSQVTAETLLLWGADDVLQSLDYARRLESDIAGETDLVALEEAYHWVVEDRTAAYRAGVREFLGEG